jgi:hypothetical protein
MHIGKAQKIHGLNASAYELKAASISQMFYPLECRPDKVMAAMIAHSNATVQLVRGP